MRHLLTFLVHLTVKILARTFFRLHVGWVGQAPERPFRDIRICAILNHTSLYEPIFVGTVPNHFLWRVARVGVVPIADKTIKRPFVGFFFKLVAGNVVPITRQRDHTWREVMDQVRGDSLVLILPEGRMKRANGLDSQGQPMTVRGGIADLLQAVGEGPLLLAYSGGLHHVQAPGERFPRLFRRVRMNFEQVDIAEYNAAIEASTDRKGFRAAVIADMERRRDLYCPTPENLVDPESPAARAQRTPKVPKRVTA